MDSNNMNSFAASDDSIQVAVRIRPLNDREKKQNAKSILTIDEENPQKIWIESKPESKSYIFDCIINPVVQQDEIFEKIGRTQADFCLKGYNSSIFAYGQTGAGKTYTMLGKQGDHRGLQPRVFEYIFQELEKFESHRVKCSYLEIYNEQIMDLLSPSGSTLLVREDQKKGVYIEGLSEEKVVNAQQAIELLNTGARNRHVSATQMNFESSRSHSLFSFTIETKDKDDDGLEKIRCSKFHFVDLAGSERQNLTGAAGQTLKEASNINKSLTVLGCVINSLVEQNQGKSRHIPYRDSKLTFILKDSLGGNSKTFIIAAISDASISFQETLSTLKFAQRAKMIKNKAQVNEENNITDVRLLRLEIKSLKDKLEQMREQEIHFEKKIKEQINDKESVNDQTIFELKERLSQLNQECLNSENDFQKNMQILKQQQQNEVDKYENIIIEMKSQLSKSFTSDVQQQIIINSQQIKLKMVLENTFSNKGDQGQHDYLFLKDTENLLDDLDDDEEMNQDNCSNQIPFPSQSSNEMMCIEEDHSEKKTHQKDQFFLHYLNNLIGKIDQSIKSRQDFSEILKKMGLESEWNTPEKMRACEKSIDSLREQYTSQLTSMSDQIRVMREDRNQQQQEISRLKQQVNLMEEELNMKNRELSKMDDKYKELCVDMRQENQQRETGQTIELEEKIIFLEEEKDKIHREYERLNEQSQLEKQEMFSLLNTLEELQQSYQYLQGQEGIQGEEIKVLKQQIREHELRELSHQFKLNNMNNELQEFISQNTLMIEEAEKWSLIEQTNEELSKKVEELYAENIKQSDQIEVLTESNAFMQSQIEEKNSILSNLEKELEEKQEKIQEQSKKNKSLQERYEELQSSYDNVQIDSEEQNEIFEQNKSLFRRCDDYVVEIEKLTKERDFLQLQVTRKQDQASRFQLKMSELQVSQKHLSGALRDAQEKLSQSQNRISNIKAKAKHIKEADRFIAEAENKLHAKDIEINYMDYMYRERVQICNEICYKFNETLEERDRQKDVIQKLNIEISKLNNDKHILQETNSRLCEANQNICKEKVNIISKFNKYQTEYQELQAKYKGLEETFNNLMLQFTTLKGENNTLLMAANLQAQQKQIPAKLEMEIQIKNEKITDLQTYLDKYTAQIRQQDKEIESLKKQLETNSKQQTQCQTSTVSIKEYQTRIEELTTLIGTFEYHCGIASELLDKLEFEKQEQGLLIETFKTQIRAMSTSIQLSQTSKQYGRKEIHFVEGKKYSKKAKKYKRKYQEMQDQNKKISSKYEEQINKIRFSQEDNEALQKKLEEKENTSKRFQEMSDDLSAKLVVANKKVTQQMEHIQYQLKCYEEDKKQFRFEYQKSVMNLEKQLDEKTKLVAQKQMRMEYFENLHKQIADALDKNNSIYNHNIQAMKEKDRKLSYAAKLQQEILHQLCIIINRKPFCKQNDEQLKLQLAKMHEFLDQRKFMQDNKENINTLNISQDHSNNNTPHNSCTPSVSKANVYIPVPSNQTVQHTPTSEFVQFTNLNLTSAIVNRDIEDFDRNLEKILFGEETNKLLNTSLSSSSDGMCSQ